MFTFKRQDKKHEPLFFINDKAVYAQFTKEMKDRIPPFRDSTKYLDSDEFRERYGLSLKESKELKKHLRSNIVPDTKLKAKFYEVRRDLNTRLYNEIDLRGTKYEISI